MWIRWRSYMKPNDPPGSWHRLVAEQKRHVLTACGRRVLKLDSREESDDTPPKRERCAVCEGSAA